jgi:hypothetical protein
LLHRRRHPPHRTLCVRLDMYSECPLGRAHLGFGSIRYWLLVDLYRYQQLHNRQLYPLCCQCTRRKRCTEECVGHCVSPVLSQVVQGLRLKLGRYP